MQSAFVFELVCFKNHGKKEVQSSKLATYFITYKASRFSLTVSALLEVHATYNSQLIYFVVRGAIIHKKKSIEDFLTLPFLGVE